MDKITDGTLMSNFGFTLFYDDEQLVVSDWVSSRHTRRRITSRSLLALFENAPEVRTDEVHEDRIPILLCFVFLLGVNCTSDSDERFKIMQRLLKKILAKTTRIFFTLQWSSAKFLAAFALLLF